MSIFLKGDQGKASMWLPFAKRQLRILKEYMRRQGLDILSKTLPLAAVTIFVSSSFGQDRIMITAPVSQGQIWISDGFPFTALNNAVSLQNPNFIPISNWDTQGNYLGNMTDPKKISGNLFNAGTTGLTGYQNNLFFAENQHGNLGKADTKGALLSFKRNPSTPVYISDIAAGGGKIYAITTANTYPDFGFRIWDINLTTELAQIDPTSDPALYASDGAEALDYYNGVLYVAWDFPGSPNPSAGVAIHDAKTGAFKSWVFYSEDIGSINDIFYFAGTLYCTDTWYGQLVTYTFSTGKIWLYNVAQYLPAVYGSPYVPYSIVANSDGIFFTAAPKINKSDLSSDPKGPAKLVSLDLGFDFKFASGKQMPHHSDGTPDFSNPKLFTGDMMVVPYYMMLQGRT